MKIKSLSFFLLIVCIAVSTSCKKSSSSSNTPTPYKSPYNISTIFTQTGLGDDFATLDKLNPSTMDTNNWYNPNFQYWTDYRNEKTWGPWPADFGEEAGGPHSAVWRQQRIIYVAQKYIGKYYQHHHLIQWNPPATWPWDTLNPVSIGHQSAGIDGPNFAAWVYNYGLGLHLKINVDSQYVQLIINGYEETPYTDILEINKPTTYDSLVGMLKIGDLIYEAKDSLSATPYHVLIWIGKPTPDQDYLIIDSFDQVVKDSKNADIPQGIQLRPFLANGWYYNRVLKIHRIIN
jgi:hypothetical protein